MTVEHPHDPIESIKSQLRVYGKERQAPTAHACATYARVSTLIQESIPVQQEECRKVAVRLDLPILDEFEDKKSGLIVDRENYQRLLTLARTGRISHVICFKTDRMGRDDVEFIRMAREMERLGVELYDTILGRVDPAMILVLAMQSNWEVRATSGRVLPVMKSKAQKGLSMQRPPFGYRRTIQKGIFELDPETAPVVVELFRRYVDGESVWSLVAWFNPHTGKNLRSSDLTKKLRKPFYAGFQRFNTTRNSKIDGRYLKPHEEWIVARHQSPDIVDVETWLAAQARLDARQNVGQERAPGPQYPLTGLIWCAACDKRVHGQPDGTGKYPFYHCPYCGKGKSNRKVEGAIRGLLEAIPYGMDSVTRALDETARSRKNSSGARVAEVTRRLDHLRGRRTNLTIMYAEGKLTDADYAAAIEKTQQELDEGTAAQASLAQQEESDHVMEATVRWLQALPGWTTILDNATIGERNEVYRHCIVACILDYPGRSLTVRWTRAIASLTGLTEQVVILSSSRTPDSVA